jgi:hypothetical protein
MINEVLEKYGFTSRYEPPEPAAPKTLDEYVATLEEKFEAEPVKQEADNE